MAVGARDPAARVHALAPEFELRVLRLDDFRPGLFMLEVVEPVTVLELVVVIILLDLFDFEAVVPRIEKRRLRSAVVFDVALGANERAHLLPGG